MGGKGLMDLDGGGEGAGRLRSVEISGLARWTGTDGPISRPTKIRHVRLSGD